MKSSATVFLAAFIALSASWGGFVLAPQLQLGRSPQEKPTGTESLYPLARPGLAAQGAEVYRSLGCVYCHSQQVGQEGVKCDIVLNDAGTNALATLAALKQLNTELGKLESLAGLPKVLMQVPNVAAADPILKILGAAGAKAQVNIVPVGTDISRGWGLRRTVAQDYVYDATVQLGTRRAGPDLANLGIRQPDVNWQLRHLYAPAAVVPGSTMPPYQFLFKKRAVKQGLPAVADAIPLAQVSKDLNAAEYELIPTDAARALAAYLVSLRADAPLFEAPFTAPAPPQPAATNSPAK